MLLLLTGVFSKPALRSTPKAKPEPRPRVLDQDDTPFTNLRSTPKPDIAAPDSDTQSNKHVFDKPKLRQTGRKMASDESEDPSDANVNNSVSKTFEKPALRATAKDLRSDSFGDNSEPPPQTFEKPVLKSTGVKHSEAGVKPEQFTAGTFEKPMLKKTTPSPEKEVRDVPDSKGMFERPALRKTEPVKEPERERTPDKPAWLQQAANKQSKVLDVLHTKGEPPKLWETVSLFYLGYLSNEEGRCSAVSFVLSLLSVFWQKHSIGHYLLPASVFPTLLFMVFFFHSQNS